PPSAGGACVAPFWSIPWVVVPSPPSHAASPSRAMADTRPIRIFLISYLLCWPRPLPGSRDGKCFELSWVSSHWMTFRHIYACARSPLIVYAWPTLRPLQEE